MATSVRVLVKHDDLRQDVSELLLTAADGRQWSKRYHGNLFLLFDAQELDLIQTALAENGSPTGRTSLKSEAAVDEEMLRKLRFNSAPAGKATA